MLLSVAERFLSKPFENLLHPAQKLLLGKMKIKITKQFSPHSNTINVECYSFGRVFERKTYLILIVKVYS